MTVRKYEALKLYNGEFIKKTTKCKKKFNKPYLLVRKSPRKYTKF